MNIQTVNCDLISSFLFSRSVTYYFCMLFTVHESPMITTKPFVAVKCSLTTSTVSMRFNKYIRLNKITRGSGIQALHTAFLVGEISHLMKLNALHSGFDGEN